jgi:hypothetical protein
MGSLIQAFDFARCPVYEAELPVICSLGIDYQSFVKADLFGIYSKILTDCVERTQGMKKETAAAMWDNCLASEANRGLVSLLSKAMVEMNDLFMVYQLGVLRVADTNEKAQIKLDYVKSGKSSLGVYVSFTHYERTKMLLIYSSMEYSVLSGLNKQLNISAAIQLKMHEMRKSVGAIDASVAKDQATKIATALKNGRDVLLDSQDEIKTAEIDMDPTEKAIGFLDAKRSFYLGMPLSYLTGEQTGGIGSTGEGDTKAVERGLKNYWISILAPTIEALFGEKSLKFKSQDFRQIDSALNALRTFELVSDDLISLENKRLIVSALADVENDVKGKPRAEVEQQDGEPEEKQAPGSGEND